MRNGIIGVALLLCASAASAQFLPLPANARTECGLNGASVNLNPNVVYSPADPSTWAARWGPCMGRESAECKHDVDSNCGNQKRCISTENNGQKYNAYIQWAGLQSSIVDNEDWGVVCGLEKTLWAQCTQAGGCGASPPNPCPPGQECRAACPTCPTCPICPPPPPTCTPNQIPANIYATTQEVATWAVISPGSKRKLRVQQMAQFFSTYQPCVESTGRNVMNLRLLIPEPAAP